MQPESSDGFASVGAILPKEEAALLPGGFFAFCGAPVANLSGLPRVQARLKFFRG
jgi:hypothetical protein